MNQQYNNINNNHLLMNYQLQLNNSKTAGY